MQPDITGMAEQAKGIARGVVVSPEMATPNEILWLAGHLCYLAYELTGDRGCLLSLEREGDGTGRATVRGRRRTMGDVRLILGDCLEVLPTLAENSVDAVIADPAYGVNLEYGNAFADTAATWLSLVPPVVQWALEHSLSLLMFGASATQHRDLAAFPAPPERTLIWAPGFSLSKSRSKGMFYRWHPIYCWNLPEIHEGPQFDVLRESCGGRNWWNHPGTKPVALMRRLVRIAPPNATILDPFMGSGTTGVACVQTGRRFIGVEIKAHYFEIAEKRIAEARQQLRLPLKTRQQEASCEEN